MKLSLWQQFSSNHSAHFTVVGVFKTPDAANQAAQELRDILAAIARWNEENPEKASDLRERWAEGEWPPPASEIELELGKKYGVEWKSGIDWQENADISVMLENLVVVDPIMQTEAGPDPFDRLIERLGGIGLVTGEDMGQVPFGEIHLVLHCHAPDEATALKIAKAKADEWCEVERWGTRLEFSWEYSDGPPLPTLIADLQAEKCTQISYQFGGMRYTETDFIDIPDDGSPQAL